MNIPEILLKTLKELGTDDFKEFQWFLSDSVLKDFKPIPKSHIEGLLRQETVDRMVQSYCKDPAVTITLKILREMDLNETARKLEEACRSGSERDITDELKPSAQATGFHVPVNFGVINMGITDELKPSEQATGFHVPVNTGMIFNRGITDELKPSAQAIDFYVPDNFGIIPSAMGEDLGGVWGTCPSQHL